VDLSKNEFVGRNALVAARAEGVDIRLRAVVLDAGHGLYGGESVMAGGKPVARIRSAAYGHSIGKDIGRVYLPQELAQPGTALEVEVLGDLLPAVVTEIPLVDPQGVKILA
jgi:glycine cleavage system aminomethyltransferase T